ncbi:hypothetical protein F511_20471 [Dorcoceras hygrometricum]|uniref:Splicing factor 3B subunit 1-like n=1 Tax=Dorcoceras hygrometricum TaxID=472368 RepID=A0A2Z7B2T8_9LAMI|nr:hypothetical protein F511_20471 [Dorcoceras hygrometricum]
MAQYQILARNLLELSGTGPKQNLEDNQPSQRRLGFEGWRPHGGGRTAAPAACTACGTLPHPACNGCARGRPPARTPRAGGLQVLRATVREWPAIGTIATRCYSAVAPGSDQIHRKSGTSTVGSGRSPNPVHDWKQDSFRLATSPHDPLGITDSACKNQLVMVSVQYGPFNTYIPIRSTTIGKSRVARDSIAMHTSRRSNSDIACVTSCFRYVLRGLTLSCARGLTIQVYFDSVFSMADEGMVQMFKALELSGLRGFLGCSSDIYEVALVDFYHKPSVRDNKLSVPFRANLLQEREMKFEFRLLNDILAKTITFKAGSFDAITHERFLMMAAIHGRGAPDLELGESKAFPPLKILTAKTVGTYIAKKKSINAEEVLEVPVEKVVKKAAAKRRPAPAIVEPAAKKKRTTVGRAAPAEKDLSIIPVVQNPEPISVVPAVTPLAQRRREPKRKLVLQDVSEEESVENITNQVIKETAEIEIEETETVEPVVLETAEIETDETESRIDVSSITNYDEGISLKVLSNEEGPLVETEKEKETENEKEKEKEKMIDSEDTEPLSKVLARTKTPMSDEESMSINDLLKRIPEEMMLPSYTAADQDQIWPRYSDQGRNPGFTAGRGFNPAGGAPGGG